MTGPHSDATIMLKAMRSALGENDMMAYLAMMAVRLIELHRVLKPTGTLYLHCDPTASHYLKTLLDAIFGPKSFRNEIIWKRNTSHNSGKRFGRIHDTIFYYTKSPTTWTWHWTFGKFSPEQLGRYEEDEDGRLYKGENLTAERKTSSSGKFEWRGSTPGPTRGWAYEVEQLEKWWEEGTHPNQKRRHPPARHLLRGLDRLRVDARHCLLTVLGCALTRPPQVHLPYSAEAHRDRNQNYFALAVQFAFLVGPVVRRSKGPRTACRYEHR